MLPPWPLTNTIRRKAVRDQVLRQIIEQVEVDARAGRERSLKVHVVVRVAQPQERRDQRPVRHRFTDAPDDFADQQAVGENRHVPPVLLERGHRHDHGNISRQVADLRPGHLVQQHRAPPTAICMALYQTPRAAIVASSPRYVARRPS
jgi:hypothetical protein